MVELYIELRIEIASYRKDDTMQNKTLIRLLEQLNPDDEICVEIKECITDQFVDTTFDVGYKKNDYGQLVLVVDVEKGKFDGIK